MIKTVYWSSCQVCLILMKFEFSPQIFKKISNIKFHEHLSSGSQAVSCGQTGRHDEANSHFLQFCKCAKKTVYTIFSPSLPEQMEVSFMYA